MSDWRDKLKQARLPEKIVPIVLRGDLAAEHESVQRQLEQARASKGNSLAGSGTAAIQERLRELEAEMADSVVEFRLRALPRSKRPGDARPSWRELADLHPPREKDGEMVAEDRLAGGINNKTFIEPLVRACVAEPELTEADWDELLTALTEGQFDQLAMAAWRLNQNRVDIPFSSGDSATPPTTSAG